MQEEDDEQSRDETIIEGMEGRRTVLMRGKRKKSLYIGRYRKVLGGRVTISRGSWRGERASNSSKR